MLRQWDDVAKKYTRYRLGYKYTFTFDGAEDVLVVKFANKQDIKQWDIGYSENMKSSRILEKCIFPARKEYVSMDRPNL